MLTQSRPANTPAAVEELEDLPTGKIRKIAAGGYVLLALTEGNDLYAWGGHPGRAALIEEISSSPSPVMVEESDILDCGVGEFHIIVLTTDGVIYTIGGNDNGQLGVPGDKVETWTRVPIHTTAQQRDVVAVGTGPRSSFILTKTLEK